MKTLNQLVALLVVLFIFACRKSVTHNTTSKPVIDSTTVTITPNPGIDTIIPPPFPQSITSSSPSCPALPIYGDSLIYMQPGQGAMLSPVNSPGAGKYYAWPLGLSIDNNTGAIDLSRSQTGMKYMIGFVPDGTTDTCMSTLIVGGASYLDSIYVVNSGGTKAVPYFDAKPGGGSNCAGQGDGSGCKFDVTGSAQAASVFVNNSSGEIDLKKTLNGQGNKGGVFGPNPVDGQSATVTIYYQLKHGSNNAMEHIDVTFVYYTDAASVPADLLSSVNIKLSNALNASLISTWNNPRPPLILIVRR